MSLLHRKHDDGPADATALNRLADSDAHTAARVAETDYDAQTDLAEPLPETHSSDGFVPFAGSAVQDRADAAYDIDRDVAP